MPRTDDFKAQHQAICELISIIQSTMDPSQLRLKAVEVRKTLSELSGKLKIHLAMEDKTLYPAMIASNNPAAKKLATDFMNEMGNLATSFKDYMARWPSASTIQENPEVFTQQTKEVFKAITHRIEREESTLYPLADNI